MSKHSNHTEQAMSEQELFSKVMDMLPLKADLNRLSAYSAYIDGARRAVALLTGHFPDIFTKGRDAPVNRAVIALIMSSKRNTHLWLTEKCEVHLRNYVYDKKGKLKSCEAFFAMPRTAFDEVK